MPLSADIAETESDVTALEAVWSSQFSVPFAQAWWESKVKRLPENGETIMIPVSEKKLT